jgi:hypothetical protein
LLLLEKTLGELTTGNQGGCQWLYGSQLGGWDLAQGAKRGVLLLGVTGALSKKEWGTKEFFLWHVHLLKT